MSNNREREDNSLTVQVFQKKLVLTNSQRMYLNKNGVRLDVVRKMIETKIDHAFEAYDNIRDRYDDVIDKFRGV